MDLEENIMIFFEFVLVSMYNWVIEFEDLLINQFFCFLLIVSLSVISCKFCCVIFVSLKGFKYIRVI